MAERPDPDTDRRNILPGEHAKPDGTWCPYLAPSNEAGVWVCMKCGNSGGVSTPDTDPNTLADRLDFMAQHPVGGYRNWNADLRAAADGLRQYAAITTAIGEHRRQHTDVDGEPVWPCCTDDEALWVAASLSVTPTPDRCPTCGSDDPRRRHAVESWISDSIRCDEPCVSPWHRYDSGQP